MPSKPVSNPTTPRKHEKRQLPAEIAVLIILGRGEAPQELSAKPDETGLVLDTYPVPITQEPLCYVSEDLIIIVSIVGKHWLRDDLKMRNESYKGD